jgi:predicted NAD/FAD-dependent oxidoreductase
MRIVIIGAGVAGLTCGQALAGAGRDILLLDKGRGPAGRLASRRIATPQGEAVLDMGTQSFTAHGADFAAEVRRWSEAGVVAPWPPAGPGAVVGVPAMNAVVRALAQDLEVRWSTRVTGLARADGGWTVTTEAGPPLAADAVVVALPAEQAAELIQAEAPAIAAMARSAPSQPCWTGLFTFAVRPDLPDVLHGGPGSPVELAVRNRAKPGRDGPESWVVHAAPAWSQAHLEREPDDAAALLRDALAAMATGPLPPILTASAHRWRYARAGGEDAGLIRDARAGLGVCGDWCGGGDLEGAWRSGARLAAAILKDGS